MDAKDFFEKFFKMNKGKSYSTSLKIFFEDNVRSKLPAKELDILDIGSGNYSLFEDVENLDSVITAIDFSSNAVKNAPDSRIKYIMDDVTKHNFFKGSEFNLIFDSHCFNCITDEIKRKEAYRNIYRLLKSEGLFASEMMVQPIGTKVSIPYKMIRTAHDIEEELISHGFKIIYFMISKDSGFMSEIDGIEIKCDLVKIIAKK